MIDETFSNCFSISITSTLCSVCYAYLFAILFVNFQIGLIVLVKIHNVVVVSINYHITLSTTAMCNVKAKAKAMLGTYTFH